MEVVHKWFTSQPEAHQIVGEYLKNPEVLASFRQNLDAVQDDIMRTEYLKSHPDAIIEE